MTLSIQYFSSPEHLFAHEAEQFFRHFAETIAIKNHFDVALSGGSTAKGFFVALAAIAGSHPHRNKIRFFFSDERVVPLASSDSNAGNAMRALREHFQAHQFFPMWNDTKDNGLISAQAYEDLLHEMLPGNGLPVFDAVYLGIGTDGHTASLFPRSQLFANQHALVAATNEVGIPFERITLMPCMLHAAKQICVMATGVEKTAIIKDIMHGPLEPENLPAQLVLRNPPNDVRLLLAGIESLAA